MTQPCRTFVSTQKAYQIIEILKTDIFKFLIDYGDVYPRNEIYGGFTEKDCKIKCIQNLNALLVI